MHVQGAVGDKTYTSEATEFPARLGVGQHDLFSYTSDHSRPIWGEANGATGV